MNAQSRGGLTKALVFGLQECMWIKQDGRDQVCIRQTDA